MGLSPWNLAPQACGWAEARGAQGPLGRGVNSYTGRCLRTPQSVRDALQGLWVSVLRQRKLFFINNKDFSNNLSHFLLQNPHRARPRHWRSSKWSKAVWIQFLPSESCKGGGVRLGRQRDKLPWICFPSFTWYHVGLERNSMDGRCNRLWHTWLLLHAHGAR